MMPERLSRSVDVDLNDALKVAEDLLVHLSGLVINGSSVHSFHHTVRRPTAPLHDVLIRDPDGVHDAGSIMPKVMEPKSVREMGKFYSPAKAIGDLGGSSLDNATVRLRDLRDHKWRKFDCRMVAECDFIREIVSLPHCICGPLRINN